jgi:hypothetical protein
MDIKQYSLSEIGAFYKAVSILDKENKIEKTSLLWSASNYTHEGIQKLLKSIEGSFNNVNDSKNLTTSEVHNEWKRLRAFMSGKK